MKDLEINGDLFSEYEEIQEMDAAYDDQLEAEYQEEQDALAGAPFNDLDLMADAEEVVLTDEELDDWASQWNDEA